MTHENTYEELLLAADVEDLDVLVDYLTDNGEGRLTLDNEVFKRLQLCRQTKAYERGDRILIGNEIRSFGGNTLVNLFRGQGVGYAELVQDVADHLKVPYSKSSAVVNVETAILQKMFVDAVDKMPAEERKKVLEDIGIGTLAGAGPGVVAAALTTGRLAGFATYRLALVVANAIARALLGRGLSFAANATLTRAMGVMLGPVGWILTGIWTLADMASPAYRVTVPCVIQIAYMRQKVIFESTTKTCGKCGTRNADGTKFCAECGEPIASASITSAK